MNAYEKNKERILNYFHTEEGKQHLKDAQKRYRHTEAGRQKNNEIRVKCYYKAKMFKDEIKRLNAINIF